MVRLIENQADAYVYRRFGRRIFLTGLLVAAFYGASGTIIIANSQAIVDETGMGGGGITGQLMGTIAFIAVVFVPLASGTIWLSRILKRAFKKMDAKRGTPMALLALARIVFLIAVAVAIAPIGLVMEAPATVISFYQEDFLRYFFSLLGVGLALVLLAPVIQLRRRTHSRALLVAAVLALGASGLLVFQANSAVWSVSIFEMAKDPDDLDDAEVDEINVFLQSYTTTMGITAGAIFLSCWIMARNASSILRRQHAHFFTQLGD